MKKITSVLLCLLLTLAMIFAFAACGEQNDTETPIIPDVGGNGEIADPTLGDIYDPNRPDYDFDYDYDYVKPDPPETEIMVKPELDPAYAAGSATKLTRMEGENAKVSLKATSSDIWKNQFSDVNNLAFDFRLSNKLCTRNLNDAWTVGTRVAFDFVSDKSYTVKMKANISTHSDEVYTPAGNFSIRSQGLNSKEDIIYSYADLEGIEIAREDTVELVSGGDANPTYFHFYVLELEVAIYEGNTQIIFEFDNGRGCNIDYIEFDTSANITGWDDTFYMDGDTASGEDDGTMWYISKQPTTSETGIFTATKYINGAYRTYNYSLPALEDENGELTEGYSSSVVEGKTQYSFDFKNDVYTFIEGEEIKATATLHENSLAKFAGGATTLTKSVGEVLQASDFEQVGGKSVSGIRIYNDKGADLGSALVGSYTMTAYPIVIEVVTLELPEGYTLYDCGNEQSGRLPQPVYGGVDKTLMNHSAAFGTVVSGTDPEDAMLGSVFTYSGKVSPMGVNPTTQVEEASQFRFNTVMSKNSAVVTLNKEHSFIYNIENLGTNALHLRLNQVNSGNSIEDGDAGVAIDLEPGESMTITINISFKKGRANKNALALFTVTQEMQDMKFGIAMAAKLAQ